MDERYRYLLQPSATFLHFSLVVRLHSLSGRSLVQPISCTAFASALPLSNPPTQTRYRYRYGYRYGHDRLHCSIPPHDSHPILPHVHFARKIRNRISSQISSLAIVSHRLHRYISDQGSFLEIPKPHYPSPLTFYLAVLLYFGQFSLERVDFVLCNPQKCLGLHTYSAHISFSPFPLKA